VGHKSRHKIASHFDRLMPQSGPYGAGLDHRVRETTKWVPVTRLLTFRIDANMAVDFFAKWLPVGCTHLGGYLGLFGVDVSDGAQNGCNFISRTGLRLV
jgi:hypothetical protein